MKKNQKNIEIKTSTRERWQVVIILIVVSILFLTIGGIAFIQINLAFQQVATAQADRIMARSKQMTAEIANATAQANVEKSQVQAQISRTNEIAAQSLAMQDKNFALSMLLGLEAYNRHDTPQSKSMILNNARANPHIIQYLSGHKNEVSSVIFSPDGNTVASASCSPGNDYRCKESIIILHDSHTGQMIYSLNTHADSVNSLAFSPDGRTLAAGGLNTITLWNVKTGQPIGNPLLADSLLINAVAFNPDGSTLASTGCSKVDFGTCVLWNIQLWDVKTRQPAGEPFIGELAKNTNVIMNLAFSLDGNTLAANSYLGIISILDVKTHQMRETLTTKQIDGHIQFLSNGTLASWGKDESSLTVMVWDLKTQQIIGEPLSLKNYTKNMGIISPDGSVFANSTEKAGILLYDMQTHEIIDVFSSHESTRNSTPFNIQAFSLDGKTLAMIGQDKNTIILARKVDSIYPIGETLVKDGPEHYASHVAFSPDNQTLAIGGAETISLWNVKTGQQIGITMKAPYIGNIAFNPDGTIIASGTCIWKSGYTCQQAGIILWDVKTGQPIGEPLTSLDELFVDGYYSIQIYSLAFSPDGQTLASGSGREPYVGALSQSDHHDILLWDVKTHKQVGQPLKGHKDSISQLAFRPDGTILASSSFDDHIILWDVKTGQAVGTLKEHKGDVRSIAFSPDGNILASGSVDGSIIVWDVKSKQPIGKPLRPNLEHIYAVTFSPDGKTLASAGWVSSVVLWDVKTWQPIGEQLYKYWGGSSGGLSIAFSPDGNTLALANWSFNDLVLWKVNPQIWIAMTCQRVGRNLTQAEWAKYLPDEKYRATCPQWPVEEVPTPTP